MCSAADVSLAIEEINMGMKPRVRPARAGFRAGPLGVLIQLEREDGKPIDTLAVTHVKTERLGSLKEQRKRGCLKGITIEAVYGDET